MYALSYQPFKTIL